MTQPTALRTPEPQRLRALERANQIRLARAGLKRRIALGEVSAADVLLCCPAEAQSWQIGELLISQRRWGSSRCRKFLSRNQLLETKLIGTLTDRQRRMLASALGPADVPGSVNGSVEPAPAGSSEPEPEPATIAEPEPPVDLPVPPSIEESHTREMVLVLA